MREEEDNLHNEKIIIKVPTIVETYIVLNNIEKNDIDKSQYNLAPSAKNIASDDMLSEDELELLIKQMQS